jgi:adenylate kinase family enzyme
MFDINEVKEHNRINIVGSPGSGKSTLASKIGELTNVNVYDLDDYLYDEFCNRLNPVLSSKIVGEILSRNEFILDGTYTSTFNQRLKYVDLIILINSKTINNIFAFLIKIFTKKNLKCGERLTYKTLMLLLKFNSQIKSKIINATLASHIKLAIYNRNNKNLKWLN